MKILKSIIDHCSSSNLSKCSYMWEVLMDHNQFQIKLIAFGNPAKELNLINLSLKFLASTNGQELAFSASSYIQ